MLVAPESGDAKLLEYLVHKTANADVKLHLYSNNYSPVETSALANFTECSGTGYGAIALTGASWTVTASTPTNCATANYGNVAFSFSTCDQCYGYYVTTAANDCVLWCERFTGTLPQSLPNSGGVVNVQPNITLN